MNCMEDRTLLRIGVVGAVIAAVCCFTPLLVGLLAVAGLSAGVAYLDDGLLPALAAFLGLAAFAWMRQRRERRGESELGDVPSQPSIGRAPGGPGASDARSRR